MKINQKEQVIMTPFALRRRAIKNFPQVTYADRDYIKIMRRKWLNSVTLLGDDWILRQPVERKTA